MSTLGQVQDNAHVTMYVRDISQPFTLFFLILMIGIQESNTLMGDDDIWPLTFDAIAWNVVRYVWDQRNSSFLRKNFNSETLWKYFHWCIEVWCDERSNPLVYFCKVWSHNDCHFFCKPLLKSERTCYVWDSYVWDNLSP